MHGIEWPYWLNGSKRSGVAWSVAAGVFAQREALRGEAAPPIAARAMSLDKTAAATPELWVEALEPHVAETYAADWRDLASRALEPNIFGEAPCLLTAAQHLSQGRKPLFLFVWRKGFERIRGRLLAVCPLRRPSALRNLVVWTHEQAAMGTPLLDRLCGREALDCLLDHIAKIWPRHAALTIPTVALEGPTAALIRNRSHPVHVFELGARAVLRRGDGPVVSLGDLMTRRRLKKLDRNRKRLADHAPLGFAVARAPDALREAAEDFLRLEAKGWKGRSRTALLAGIPTATFARTLIRSFAASGQCRILSLTLGGAPVAMAVVLTTGDHAFIWKVAYDEDFSSFSPGTQLILDLTRAHLTEAAIAVTDSCAVPGHPMIDHIWPDRLPIGDLAIALPGASVAGFQRAVTANRLARNLRQVAKKAVRRLRGGKQT